MRGRYATVFKLLRAGLVPLVDELQKWPQFSLLHRMHSIYDVTNLPDSPLKRWKSLFLLPESGLAVWLALTKRIWQKLCFAWIYSCSWTHASTIKTSGSQPTRGRWGQGAPRDRELTLTSKATQPKTHEGTPPRSEEPPNWVQPTLATCGFELKIKSCYFKPISVGWFVTQQPIAYIVSTLRQSLCEWSWTSY